MPQGAASSLARELRRRKVPRSLVAYIVISWALIQGCEVLLPLMGIDNEEPLRVMLILAFAGTPLCIAIAWFYQITDDGIVRTEKFAERRILDNIAPIKDRRSHSMRKYFGGKNGKEDYVWVLEFESGPLLGLTYGLSEEIVIGRALECDITVLTNHVSRQHAKLKVTNDQLLIEDLDSSNGTRVNGELIDQPTALSHKDEIRLQDVSFKVAQTSPESPTRSSAMNKTTMISPKKSS